MRSAVLLLAALFAARLRLGGAEGDPLPSSLVHLVRNSPISSVDDLELLLQETNGIEEEEDEHDAPANHTHHRRLPRSLVEAQQAQQAACKVRTEVMKVERSSANFLLWPPCVEVQRCSGCCNTWVLQCVPTLSSTRYLQVTKIRYVNRKVHYEKAIISVEDHVSCRCQAASSVPIQTHPRPLPPTPLQPAQPLPRTVHANPPPKTHGSKADLHRHDDLKHNQQAYGPEERDPAVGRWQQGGYTQLVHWTHLGPSEARAEHSVMGGGAPQVGHGSGYAGSREEGGVHAAPLQRQQQLLQHQQLHRGGAEDQELGGRRWLDAPQSDAGTPPASPTRPPKLELSPAPPTALVTSRRQAEVTGRTGGGEREESGSANSRDSGEAEPANQGPEKDSEQSRGVGHLTEEERRHKVLEMIQTEPDHRTHLRPHHPKPRPKPTSFKSGLSASTPGPPPARRAPFRPASPRRRRKHSKRISKAAMRAMIM
ncbi:platelet-derived growth factor beta polypeptide a [Pungitius pungitius]|uniref:platelet-derived growth factor beta polypeptide a n=1 Tax=Pungitius pungitius TaxID=134920 RepID=UPI002E119713